MERRAETAARVGPRWPDHSQGWVVRTSASVGAVNALFAAMLYLVGWDRALSWDASRTVGQFVTADSLRDVFRQDRFNNHPLLSFLEYLVHSAS